MARALNLRAAAAVLVMLAGGLCPPSASRAQSTEIETDGQAEFITVNAVADMQVDPRTVWNVITDYDHLAEFIPYMRSSRVVQRDGERLLVEQTGDFSFLFFQQPIEAKLSVVESPPHRVVARAIGGNLRVMEGRYTVEKLPTGSVKLTYSGRLVPDFPVPPVIGKMVVRNMLARQFNAMVKEIVRRDGARGLASEAGDGALKR